MKKKIKNNNKTNNKVRNSTNKDRIMKNKEHKH